MNIETLPARTLYGIETRTSNATPQDIAALWQRFTSENLADDIPDRVDDNLIAAYFDYEGDHTQPFTFFLGCEVIDACCAGDDFVLRELPVADYATFRARGEMPQALIETWQEIWSSQLNRSYLGDFEIHDPSRPQEVVVHVGVE
ncbi:MAG: GyrI-like domain-containing protein [Rhodopirellula sp. JB055]|uniref:GyrI-like domain-containing protein n=1 Tax=Rhodopirellula sp. JB055 TaxID=3342846 RepID=UPI00370BC7D7